MMKKQDNHKRPPQELAYGDLMGNNSIQYLLQVVIHPIRMFHRFGATSAFEVSSRRESINPKARPPARSQKASGKDQEIRHG